MSCLDNGCPTLALEWRAGLLCITEKRAYPALEPGRETRVAVDVHAEDGIGAISRGGCDGRFSDPFDSRPRPQLLYEKSVDRDSSCLVVLLLLVLPAGSCPISENVPDAVDG